MTDFAVPVFEPPTFEPAGPPERPRRGRKPGSVSAGNKALVRAVRILRLQPRQRELLAKLLGVKSYNDRSEPDVVRLLAAASEASALARVIQSVGEIAACADGLEAGALAAELAIDKSRMSLAWAAVGAEGPVPFVRPGLALAKAVKEASPSTISDLKSLGGAL